MLAILAKSPDNFVLWLSCWYQAIIPQACKLEIRDNFTIFKKNLDFNLRNWKYKSSLPHALYLFDLLYGRR